MSESDTAPPSNFIKHIIDGDLKAQKNEGRVHTRFPPEPNGYLHVGHAKSICLNFGIAEQYSGLCNLRFDDTNPEKESVEYVKSIKRDVEWLGYEWAGEVHYASDYFQQFYDYAVALITSGKAYVCGLTPEQAREYRGTLTEPGKNSPDRDREIEENLVLFQRMKQGEFEDGQYSLRAKVDMSSPNINMRDPVIYRIRSVIHHQTGDDWCIYPMYDYAHCISDAIEKVTHSLCTLEFEDHRPLYDWFLDTLEMESHPQQIEFARLNLNYTVTSKRKLKTIVDEGLVLGWDDPRMPTIAGLRRRGYTPASIRHFCDAIGVTKSDSVVDLGMLEFAIRDDLDSNAPRAMCVLAPLKVVITNFPDGKEEFLQASRHPKNESMGKRGIPFSRELYIDRNDFMESPPSKYFRLAPNKEVRLRNAYVIKCDEVIKGAGGVVQELRCSYDDKTLGKKPEGRKVKGVIHWVSVQHALPVEVRLYDRLFNEESPDKGDDFHSSINESSLVVVKNAMAEPSLAKSTKGSRYQFEREGYFCIDSVDSMPNRLIFNRTVSLKDSWAKEKKK
ncbi:MAG: glutamine--tRNA ligase/YqeY domain fusion protein [Pseudomonadales bacterium]|nr:glutamine--tRNA ligase/YqeY domain fusion protein [Pseudomonadales bacterium]